MNNVLRNHPSPEALLDYWLDHSDAAATDALDEHLMQCDACGAVLDGLVALGDGVRTALRRGEVTAIASDAFVQHLAGSGQRVREYRLPLNGSVNCTVAPDDHFLVARLAAPLAGVERLDMLAQRSTGPALTQRLQDIPFDAQAGEVIYVAKIAEIKQLPAHTLQLTLLAVAPGDTRELGRYTFNHRPWPGH